MSNLKLEEERVLKDLKDLTMFLDKYMVGIITISLHESLKYALIKSGECYESEDGLMSYQHRINISFFSNDLKIEGSYYKKGLDETIDKMGLGDKFNDLLKKTMINQGRKWNWLASKMGWNKNKIHRKVLNNSFSTPEQEKIKKLLGI